PSLGLPLRPGAAAPAGLSSLSLHDALPIFAQLVPHPRGKRRVRASVPIRGICVQVGELNEELGRVPVHRILDEDRDSAEFFIQHIGRAHVSTPLTYRSRMPSSAGIKDIVPT